MSGYKAYPWLCLVSVCDAVFAHEAMSLTQHVHCIHHQVSASVPDFYISLLKPQPIEAEPNV